MDELDISEVDSIEVDMSEHIIETGNYNNLLNKPQINGVELVGNKTTEELGIEIPNKTSELENDSGFLENKGTFVSWEELNDCEFKDTETFLFYLSGEFYLYSGLYIGSFDGYKPSTGSYIYKYINSYNVDTQKSITLDLLKETITVKQLNIEDTNDYFASDGLDDILQEIGGQLNGVEELLGGI